MSKLPFSQPCGLRVWESELQRPEFIVQQGFCYSHIEESKDAYRFAALVDLKKLTPLFYDCAALVSDESFFVLEYYPDKVSNEDQQNPPEPTIFYSPYMETQEILELLEPYLSRLIHDGFVGFGLANSRLGAELFYSEEKALTCFTANHIRAINIFTRHGLKYQEELLFPADFDHDHFSLVSLDPRQRPAELRKFREDELDYINYCEELVDLFEMQSTTANDDFFLSCREQDQIGQLLAGQEDLEWTSDDEFIHLMLDWKAFVTECSQGFTGSLDDYATGLKIRDIIAFVIDHSDSTIQQKLLQFIADSDNLFRRQLVETSRHIPTSTTSERSAHPHFWRWGITRNQGATLRRDLIRSGWFSSRP